MERPRVTLKEYGDGTIRARYHYEDGREGWGTEEALGERSFSNIIEAEIMDLSIIIDDPVKTPDPIKIPKNLTTESLESSPKTASKVYKQLFGDYIPSELRAAVADEKLIEKTIYVGLSGNQRALKILDWEKPKPTHEPITSAEDFFSRFKPKTC